MSKKITDYYAKIRSRLQNGSFWHNVLTVITGAMLGQMMSVILSPLLTRVYSPEEFGVMGIFSSISSIISVIACLRYEMAVTIAKDDDDAINLLAVCGVALLSVFCIGIVITYCLSGEMLGSISGFAWLIPVGALCIGSYNVMVAYATRKAAFAAISKTKIYQGVAAPFSQLGLGVMGAGIYGLIFGFIAGQSMGITNLFRRLVWHHRQDFSLITRKKMWTVAARFKNFPLFSSWSGLISAASGTSMLLLFMPFLYSGAIAGFIYLIERVVARPLLIISSSILQVYIGDISKSKTNEKKQPITKRFLQIAAVQFTIVSGWLLAINGAAYLGFGLLFGKDWAGAVPYLQVMSISYLTQMTMHALIFTLQIIEKQKLSAVWEVGRLLAIVASFLYAYNAGFSALQALMVYSIVQSTAQIILFVIMYFAIRKFDKSISA